MVVTTCYPVRGSTAHHRMCGSFIGSADAIVNGTYGTDEAATAPEPATVAAFVGLLNSLIIGLYVCLFDGPQWEALIASKVTDSGHTGTVAALNWSALGRSVSSTPNSRH